MYLRAKDMDERSYLVTDPGCARGQHGRIVARQTEKDAYRSTDRQKVMADKRQRTNYVCNGHLGRGGHLCVKYAGDHECSMAVEQLPHMHEPI